MERWSVTQHNDIADRNQAGANVATTHEAHNQISSIDSERMEPSTTEEQDAPHNPLYTKATAEHSKTVSQTSEATDGTATAEIMVPKSCTPEYLDTADRLTIFSLPAEVRNEIYSLALKQASPIRPGRGAEAGLLLTHRQIRHEARLMYYTINDLEFDFQRGVASAYAPALGWAYYHIPAETMEVGQKLVLKLARLTASFEQRMRGRWGRKGLVLTDLAGPYVDNSVRVRVERALEYVFANEEMDMVPWLGHNVVRGLLRYFQVWSSFLPTLAHTLNDADAALHFIGGEAGLADDTKALRFFDGW